MANLRRQAQQAAQLRYAGQFRGLRALLAELQANRDAEILGARAQRRGTVQAIRQARPDMLKAYDAESAALDANAAAIAPTNANLGAAAQSILTAASGEHQAAKDAAARSRRQTAGDLTDQRLAAVAGEGYAVRGARQRYSADAGKALQQLIELSGEQGLFAASTLNDLRGERAGRRLEQKRIKETQRHNRVSEGQAQQKIDKSGKPNNGRGWAPQGTQNTAITRVSEGLPIAEKFALNDTSREVAESLLLKGVKEKTAARYDPATGKKVIGEDGHEVVDVLQVGVPQIKDRLIVQAVIEQAYDGHISRKTQRALHKRGIKIGPLGVTPFGKRPRTGPKAEAFSPNRPTSGPPY